MDGCGSGYIFEGLEILDESAGENIHVSISSSGVLIIDTN